MTQNGNTIKIRQQSLKAHSTVGCAEKTDNNLECAGNIYHITFFFISFVSGLFGVWRI